MRKIDDENGGAFISETLTNNGELITPVDLLFNIEAYFIECRKEFFYRKKNFSLSINDMLLRDGLRKINSKIDFYKNYSLKTSLMRLLEAQKKKEQTNFLKGLTISTDELMAFWFYGWENYNYELIRYRFEHLNVGDDMDDFPKVAYLNEDGLIEKIGNSKFNDDELRHRIKNRHTVIVNIMINSDSWHCLFTTHNSLTGNERHANGQPHFHYISDKWNLSKEYLIDQLKSRKYSLPSLPHIIIDS